MSAASSGVPHWKTLIDDNNEQHYGGARKKGKINHRESTVVTTPLLLSICVGIKSLIGPFLVLIIGVLWLFFEYPKLEKCQLEINRRQIRLTLISISSPCNEEYDIFQEFLPCSQIKEEADLSPIPLIVTCWLKNGVVYNLLMNVYHILTFNSMYSWVLVVALFVYPLIWMRYHFSKMESLQLRSQLSQFLFGMENNRLEYGDNMKNKFLTGEGFSTTRRRKKRSGIDGETFRPLTIDGRTRIEEIRE